MMTTMSPESPVMKAGDQPGFRRMTEEGIALEIWTGCDERRGTGNASPEDQDREEKRQGRIDEILRQAA